MVKAELIKRSPLRIFEKTIHGGVGKGNIGVIASKKGVGKTACLVHIATDKLIRGRHVIHVSFAARIDHIINWYEDIFKEIAKKRNLENAVDVHDELVKNRVIMNFNREGVKTSHILESLRAMIRDGHFEADAIIFDGWDIEKSSEDDLDLIKTFAREMSLEVWFSISLEHYNPAETADGIPSELRPHLGRFDVVVTLAFDGDHVRLIVVKDHDSTGSVNMHLMLDPKTLLIAEEG